jgi:hypothetical protein
LNLLLAIMSALSKLAAYGTDRLHCHDDAGFRREQDSHALPCWTSCQACLGTGICASGIAAAHDPTSPYLGMTEAQIIACAGEPHSRFKIGAEKETLTYYYSDAGPVPAEKPKATRYAI